MGLLVVCTANMCRSPMAAALLAARLNGVPELLPVESAGLLAGGSPASHEAVRAVAARGCDLSGHVSRRLTAELLADASLVLAMERRHLREALLIDPGVLTRSFTLREIVRRAEAHGSRRAEQPLAEWLADLGAGRTSGDLFGDDEADDIADPVGRGRRHFNRLADELTGLADTFAALVAPAQEAQDRP